MDLRVMFLTFGLIFLAELGDKTQLAVFSMSAKHQSPLSVFLGGTLALALVTFIAAFIGDRITRYLPIIYIQLSAGVLFVGIGIVVLWQSIVELMT